MLLTFVHLKCFMKSLRFILQGEGSLVITSMNSSLEDNGHLFGPNLVFWGLSSGRCLWSITSLPSWYWGKLWGIHQFDTTSECLKIVFRTKIVGKRLLEESLKRCDRILKEFSSTRRVIWSVVSCYLCLPISWFCVRIRTSGSHENGTPN